MDSDDFLILRNAEAIGLLSPAEALEAIEEAWREYGSMRTVLSNPAAMALGGTHARFKAKGATLPGAGLAGFRIVADVRDEAGQEMSHDWQWIADPVTGRPRAMVETLWLHELRTAATGALAAKLLAPAGITRAALIGAGRIAGHLPGALAAALPGITELRVAARRMEAVEEFCAAHAGGAMALIPKASVAEAVEGAELIICITAAGTPVLHAAMLSPGATVIGLGDQELAPDVLGWSQRFFVDELGFALTVGNVGGWLRSGALTQDAVVARLDADLGEVLVGTRPGRLDPSENVLAVVQGMAIGDLALAALAWRKARLKRLGIRVPLGDDAVKRPRGPQPRRFRLLR